MKAPVEAPRLENVSSNDGPSTGRLLLFVIDENYLRFGGARAVLRTAERVMETLAPGDLVGLARLPTGAGGVEFTTNRDRIRRALANVSGGLPRPTERVRLGEAHAFDTNDMSTWTQVINRECGDGGTGGAAGSSFQREACINEVEAQARNVLTDAAARTRQSISGYEGLATSLAAMKAPVNIVLISEGLYVGRERNDLTHLAELAARARTTFYVVQPDESMFEMTRLGPSAGSITTRSWPRGSSSWQGSRAGRITRSPPVGPGSSTGSAASSPGITCCRSSLPRPIARRATVASVWRSADGA